ncbi:MAG: M23 family metallopeptidase [Candidatus Riflebacteria bacterium]|jgi:murein DD-endopeptidase MepM/ murein hydrolase activator NlpD|nr:M23 family metallopeptidase [Candidatus Riflebacteria bacterium]
MNNSRHKPLSLSVRFFLILAGLILLQWNVPVQSCNSLQICADFRLPEQQRFHFYGSCKEMLATAKTGFSSFFQTALMSVAVNENKSKPKSFKIVSIKSTHSAARNSWPVKGAISSGYGMRRHPVTHRNSFHNGIDIKAKQGTSILSPAEGVVVCAARAGLMGRMVKIKTRAGKTLYFGHMHRIKCKKGDRVKPGQIIGTVGSSGRATGPHLHFSVVSAGRYINPLTYLSAD